MKKGIAILMAMMFVCFSSACGTPAENNVETSTKVPADAPVAGADKPLFGILVPTLGNEYYVNEVNVLTESIESQGYELIVSNYDGDVETQVTMLENFIEQGVDAAYLFPADEYSIADIAQQAEDAGMILVSNGIQFEGLDCYVGIDQTQAGYRVAEMANEYIIDKYGEGEDIKVAAIAFTSITAVNERSMSMQEKLKELYPTTTIYPTIDGNTTDVGMESAELILQSHPDVKVWICCNDATALGVLETYRAAGKEADIGIFGVDGTNQASQEIKNGGGMAGSLGFYDLNVGTYMVDWVVNGAPVEEYLEIPYELVTSKTIDAWLER